LLVGLVRIKKGQLYSVLRHQAGPIIFR